MTPRRISRQFRRLLPIMVLLVTPGAGTIPDQPDPAQSSGELSLVLDDGTIDISIGLEDAGQFLWLNRFTPDQADFPFTVHEVQLLFGSGTGVSPGQLVDIYLYEDTDGDGDPGTGAGWKGSLHDQAVQAADDITWSVYPVPFVAFDGPGDILIAVVNRTAGINPGSRPAALDESTSNSRSWLATYVGNPPDPPTFPAPLIWTIISGGGNWMIRGYATLGIVRPGIGFEPDSMFFSVGSGSADSLAMTLTNTSVDTIHFVLSDTMTPAGDVPWLSEIPPSGIIPPGGTAIRSIIVNAAGLDTGDYAASVVIASDDMFHPDTTMLVFLHVGGAPAIVVSPDSLLFPLPVIVNNSDTLIVSVTNAGSTDLHIDSILSSNPAFLPYPTSAFLDPGESTSVAVVFSPDTAGQYTGLLNFLSDDPDEPSLQVPMLGEGVTAPAIVLDTDSISVRLDEGDSVDVTVMILNPGGSPLSWSASIVPPAQTRAKRSSGRDPGLTARDLSDNHGPARIRLRRDRVPAGDPSVLFDNGPLINSDGTGVDGADESVLQNLTLGMSTFGFSDQLSLNGRVADDFTVLGNGWQVDSITFYAYQTYSDTATSIDHVNYRIWDGPPGLTGSEVVFGDTSTNRLLTSSWTNIYRVSESTSGMDTDRPVMKDIAEAGLFLVGGTYWLDWQTGGTLSSGPWAPPVTITGETTTGDGLLFLGSWVDAVDLGPQGFPFILHGSVIGDFVAVLPPTSGVIPPGGQAALTVRLTGTHPDTVLAANLQILSNDPVRPGRGIPVLVSVGQTTDVADDPALPSRTMLFQNYPNPFNPSTAIRFALAAESYVTIRVFDILGREVVSFEDGELTPGYHVHRWDGTNAAGNPVASGVYLYVLEASRQDGKERDTLQRRMILLR